MSGKTVATPIAPASSTHLHFQIGLFTAFSNRR
jgi:hypothetical protein